MHYAIEIFNFNALEITQNKCVLGMIILYSSFLRNIFIARAINYFNRSVKTFFVKGGGACSL